MKAARISYTDRLLFGAMPGSWREFIAHATRVCNDADAELAKFRKAGRVLAEEVTATEASASTTKGNR